VEATSFSEYVAQQPSDRDLTEPATHKLVSLLRSRGPLYVGTDSDLLNGLGTFGFVWGDVFKANALLLIGKGHAHGAPQIMSSTPSELGENLLLLRICA
jgi:hypothetical protein